MAKAIASRAREIFHVTLNWDVSKVRYARYALDSVSKLLWDDSPTEEDLDAFFTLPEGTDLYESYLESTGVWIDVENEEPMVFWEIYDSYDRQNTPYLSLAQLDAIANNQPLPQGDL
jgi:hypothetical protein